MLFGELVKIARQFQGSENIFGYKSTIANQLFLIYCFCGKIFFTDKVAKPVKYFWYALISCQILFSYFLGIVYLLYEPKNDPGMMLNVANVIASFHMAAFGFPLISYSCRNRIEKMIELVDRVYATKTDFVFIPNNVQVVSDAKKDYMLFFGPYFTCLIIHVSVCVVDVVVFFGEYKVKNLLYYEFPILLVQEYGTVGWFAVISVVSVIIYMIMILQIWMVLAMLSFWSTVWRDQLISIRDYFNAKERDLNDYVRRGDGCLDDWNEAFENILEAGVKRFQKTIILIDYLRGFMEVLGTVLITGAYFYGLFDLYISTSSDLPLVLKMKYITSNLETSMAAFLFYRIGQSLDNSMSEVSFAVYSSPWYQSVKIRQTVYVLLSQTQSVKNFTIFKVYGLLLNNFSRYVNALLSYTNILRRLSKK